MFLKVQALRFKDQHIHVPFNLITVFLFLFNDESIIFYLEEVMSFLIIHIQIKIGLTNTKLSVLCIKYHEDRKHQIGNNRGYLTTCFSRATLVHCANKRHSNCSMSSVYLLLCLPLDHIFCRCLKSSTY